MPLLSATATAFQLWAAGAGNWSVPSTEASGTMILKQSTVTTVPTKMPANWAKKLLPRVGAEQVAALQVGQQIGRRAGGAGGDVGAIRLTFMLPGSGDARRKSSCVTLPMAPMGVVSVSPVTRQATRARKNESSTASTLCQ